MSAGLAPWRTLSTIDAARPVRIFDAYGIGNQAARLDGLATSVDRRQLKLCHYVDDALAMDERERLVHHQNRVDSALPHCR